MPPPPLPPLLPPPPVEGLAVVGLGVGLGSRNNHYAGIAAYRAVNPVYVIQRA